jgi:diaminopimelate epimerase
VVKENDDWDEDYLFEMGSFLRHHSLFEKTNGANVTFFDLKDPHRIHAVTYERGVEAVTMACGTGSASLAYPSSPRRPGEGSRDFPSSNANEMTFGNT